MESQLTKRFSTLAHKLGANEHVSRRWSIEFAARYTEKHRFYHTLLHIHAMFTCLESARAPIGDTDAVHLAIFFHDWVYDPTQPDNEVQSIKVFEEFAAELKLDPILNDKVCKYIQRTITHTLPTGGDDGGQDTDLRLFLDADLEVLARPPEKYIEYARQIRMEYSHYSDRDFSQGRAQVLQNFLERDQIYFSSTFAGHEDVARRNISAEIASLRGEDSIPTIQ